MLLFIVGIADVCGGCWSEGRGGGGNGNVDGGIGMSDNRLFFFFNSLLHISWQSWSNGNLIEKENWNTWNN